MAFGSAWLSRGLHRLGTGLALLPGLLGLITALAADSPEITSAITALSGGDHEVGVGVVLGSNLFNLAALMGFSAILAGNITMQRNVLAFNAAVSLLETGFVALMMLHVLTPVAGMAALAATFSVYVLAVSLPGSVVKRSPLPREIRRMIAAFLDDVHTHHHKDVSHGKQQRPGWRSLVGIVCGLVLVVAGSMGTVHTAIAIGDAWNVPHGLIGALLLAALTGFPNAYTSIRLALRNQGTAVVSETVNSNTINMVIGVGVPALVFGMAHKPVALTEIWWLLGFTAFVSALTWVGNGLSRTHGMIIVTVYLAFVAARVIWG
nr:hypothetical protein [Salinisphaera sp. LB1]